MNLEFLKNSQVRIALMTGGSTFLFSALLSALVGAGFLTILGRAFAMGVLMGGLSVALVEVLRKTVPEVTELFEQKGGPVASQESDDNLFSQDFQDDVNLSSDSLAGEEDELNSAKENIRIDESEISRQKSVKPKKKAAKEGDIIAEGVALENNPELMAEAVKHILDTDKDET